MGELKVRDTFSIHLISINFFLVLKTTTKIIKLSSKSFLMPLEEKSLKRRRRRENLNNFRSKKTPESDINEETFLVSHPQNRFLIILLIRRKWEGRRRKKGFLPKFLACSFVLAYVLLKLATKLRQTTKQTLRFYLGYSL